MTDSTLNIILQNVPSIVGAVLAGMATVIGALALRKGKENGEKADVANVKADAIAVKTDEIHRLADGNLSRITEDLKEANKNIANIHGLDDDRLIAVLERHESVLSRLDGDVAGLRQEVRGVRERQHDFANFLNELGLKFDLRRLPKPDLNSGEEKT